LRINLKGREEEGIVSSDAEYEALRDMLVTGLSELVDPDTGYRVVERVYRREELYDGPLLAEAPDLIVEPVRDRDDYRGNYAEHGLNPALTGQIFASSSRLTGNHTRDGVFIAAGPAFSRGVNLGVADITDIVPTVLHVLGVPFPPDLDGAVLRSALTDQLRERPLPVFEGREEGELLQEPSTDDVFTDAEAEELTRRLRDLGYLG
jgi:predicted AlkP superfamily phosphohydrolase/phosphomutase